MRRERHILAVAIAASGLTFLAGSSGAVQTGASCDASTRVRSCQASGRLADKFIELRSNTHQCSVVEWEYDGIARSTTIVDGIERLEVLQPKQSGVEIMACTVVKDLRQINEHSTAQSARCESAQRAAEMIRNNLSSAALAIEMNRPGIAGGPNS